MLLVGICFFLEGVHPFGSCQILVTDFWHQYYPFLHLLQEKLKNGESLLYTWQSGLGSSFLPIFAYYAASPLNFITLLFPESMLREVTTLIVLIKIGTAGGFFSIFLRGTFHRHDISLSLFGSMYALSFYILGYYWNIIWLDTIALLPLVLLGLVYLIRDGKYRLYVIALFLSIFSNFYIGWCTCLFVIIAFLCLLILYTKPRQIFRKTAKMAISSLLGVCLAGIILIPTLFALQSTYSINSTFPQNISFYHSWRELLSTLISFHVPTTTDGYPNLTCGLFALLLLGIFLRTPKIRIREKILAIIILSFLVISCNCNILDYLWHGFHFPNMLPARFSYLFAFTLLTIGYRAFSFIITRRVRYWDILVMSLIAIGLFALCIGIQSNQSIWYSLVVMFLYILLLFLYIWRRWRKWIYYLLLSLVMLFELGENTYLAITTVGTSDYESYPLAENSVSLLLNDIDNQEDALFYRTEMASPYTLNDPALYNYNGLSQFSSMANSNVTTWMRTLGLSASEAGNRYTYNGSTPITNIFCGIDYVISRNGELYDTFQWESIAQESNSIAYHNSYMPSIGFCTKDTLLEYIPHKGDIPLENQNELFTLATGIDSPLFTPITLTADNSYTASSETVLYGYVRATSVTGVTIQKDDEKISYSLGTSPYVFFVGDLSAGQSIQLTAQFDKDATNTAYRFYIYALDTDLLQDGVNMFQRGQFTITSFSDTTLSGNCTAIENGLCYFSMPYDSGWTASVDGIKTNILSVGDAMTAIPITEGEHHITLHYRPKGFIMGIIFTCGSILLFFLSYFGERLWKRKRKTLKCEISKS